MAQDGSETQTRAESVLILFNEIEPFAASWMANQYTEATIDARSIRDLTPADVAGFCRVHFFAGIGGWELALQLAGWPEDEEIWTGSCPCQPFSVAGKRGGTADERHLWPEFFRLIKACRPRWAMGEQVLSADGLAWLDGVFDDLEAEGYTCWAVDTCAAGVGAPHIRQRLYWVAYAGRRNIGRKGRDEPTGRSIAGGIAHRLGDAEHARSQIGHPGGGVAAGETGATAITAGPWSNAAIIHCRDGKSRPISPESGDEPLANGIPIKAGHIVARLGELGIDPKTAKRIIANARRNRTGRLRGYGNAIVPQCAVEFIKSVMETQKGSEVV